MKHKIKKLIRAEINEYLNHTDFSKDELISIFDMIKNIKKEHTLQEVMDDFYDEYETSYIDANTHGIIVKLIETLKDNELIDGDWDDKM